MADRNSPSPARRPQMHERYSSSQSISKASPSALTSTSHKGSSHRLHKAHAVGHHGRHPHGRVPSLGKNLNRLSKQGQHHDEAQPKQHTRNRSTEIATSPSATNFKRNSSNISLPRTASKVSMKKTSSGIAFQHRNASAGKLGKGGKAEKTHQLHHHDAPVQAPSKAKPKFSVGSQDDDWTEESPSPNLTKHLPTSQKQPPPADLPSPDDPPGRSPTNLPHSPPQSPPAQTTPFADQQLPQPQKRSAPYARPPDAEAMTSRLLSRHIPTSYLSSVSATVTPTGSNASPAFHHTANGNASPPNRNDPSLPSDGISRFLHPAGSSGSGSANSNSITHLQSTLAALHREQHKGKKPRSPTTSSPPTSNLEAARRARSAANLTHAQLETSSSHSTSPPPARNTNAPGARASPFESAAPKAPSKSLTQLKLDLQRISSEREDSAKKSAPSIHGSHSQMNISQTTGTENDRERRQRQYSQASRELRNAQRFDDIILKSVRRLEKRGLVERKKDGKGEGERRDGQVGKVGSLGRSASRPPSRGRVRFEVGREEGGEDEEEEEEEDSERALLRRMWEGDGGGEGDGE